MKKNYLEPKTVTIELDSMATILADSDPELKPGGEEGAKELFFDLDEDF